MSYVGLPNVGIYDYFIYTDAFDSNKIKARNSATGKIDFNHATDFGNVFNSCVNALTSGGSIYLDSGTFLTTTSCIIKNFISVIGQGGSTVIKLANSVNGGTHVMATPSVDSMTGTDDPAGANVVHDVTLRDFVIDGNKANNATGGCGLKKYAYGWSMDNIQIRFAKSHGLVSEWAATAGVAVAGQRGMEDYNSRIHVMRCDGKGIYWRGPHDAHFVNCLSFGHGLENWHIQSGTGFSGGSSLVQCHTWSGSTVTPSDSLWIDNSFCNAAAISLEGAHDAGKAALHLTSSAKLVGSNVWCFASDIGMLIESDFNNIHGYVSGVDSIGCSVQSDHNNLDINIVDMVDTGGYGLVVGASGNSVAYNRIRARTSKINDYHVSWDNASNANNSLEISSVIDTSETMFNNLSNLNTATNNVRVHSVGPGTHNYSPIALGAAKRMSERKWGTWSGFSGTAGDGIFSAFTQTTSGAHGLTYPTGRYVRWTTPAAAGTTNNAGILYNTPLTVRGWNPRLKVRFKLNEVTNNRLWIGFQTSTSVNPTLDTELNTKSGIYFGKRSTDTSWVWMHNNASGTALYTNVTGNPAPDTNVHTIEIAANDASSRFEVMYDNTTYQDITSQIPAQSTQLTVVAQVQPSAAEAKILDVFYIEMETDK